MEELNDFRQRLETHFPSLTKSEQQIASYLMANYDEAAFQPAAELALRLGVSEATVVRFARAIGYDGFPELRRVLQQIFRTKVTPASRLQTKLAELSAGQGHILTKVIDMELQYLTEAERSVAPADFDRAVALILNSQRVFAFSTGPSAILAEMLELRLRRFGVLAMAMTDTGRNLLEKLQLLQAGDVVLAMAFNRLRGELSAVIDHACACGCPTILLTDTLGSLFKDKAEVILAARRGPVSTFHSLTVPMVILNALVLAVAMARPEASLTALDRLQRLREIYDLDVPPARGTS